jgi:hypothetical protein
MNGNNFLNYLRNCRCKAAQKVIEDSGGDVAKGAGDAITGAGGAVKGIFKRLGKQVRIASAIKNYCAAEQFFEKSTVALALALACGASSWPNRRHGKCRSDYSGRGV